MRDTQFGRTRGTTSRGVAVATLASFLFVVLGWMLAVPAPATADVAISDKLSIFGDFRARYEIDQQDRDNTGAVDRDRDRARIRARFGFKHKTTDKVSFGMRFATRADALQSPHQDLDVTDGRNDEFGLDRAYIETKWGKSGFAWFGKHGISFWEQNEQFWDGDIQPEGAGAGYKFGLASGASLLLQSTFTYLNEEGWGGGAADDGAFEDDFGATLQAVYNKGPLTAAVGSLFIGSQGGNNSFQGGSATYTLASIQYKTKAADLPLKLGYDWLHGENVVNDGAGNYVTGGSKDETGYVVNASTKKGKWGFQFKHYYVPLNSVPLQGQVSQDNFPASSNFRGQRYQLGYNLGNGMKADFRIYHQEILAGVANAQNWTQQADDSQRYQVNLNAKF